jgi:hypothetical protein
MNNPDALPFSKKRQEAVLGHLLKNVQFFMLCKDRIKSEWFNFDATNAKLWAALLNFWKRYERYPSNESEFLEFPDISCEDQLTRNRLTSQYTICINESNFHGLDTIKPLLEEWLQTQIYMRSMSKSSTFYNKGDISEAFKIIREGMQEVQDTRFTPDEAVDFNQWYEKELEATGELENALTFGIDLVDKLLTPEAKKGGLLRGDTTVLLAPTNIGKTTCMITIACANIKNGKDVLFINHEGREGDILQKMLRCMVGLTVPQYRRMIATPAGLEIINKSAALLRRHMLWLPLCKPGLTVEELDSIINRKTDEWGQRYGHSFDLLVDDFPALLHTEKNSKGNLAKRHSDDLIYTYFTRWALTHKFHSLVAIQGNRESSKVNRKLNENETRLLTLEDCSESFGPMQSATNVLTINRDPKSMEAGVVTYYLGKSRSSETGFAILCKSDYASARTHSNSMGGTWYRGAATMTDRISDLLGQYKGQQVPDNYIFTNNKEGS